MLTLIGQTIYYDGHPVAWLTIPNGTLRGQVEQALDDLPDVTPLRTALNQLDEAEGTAATLALTGSLVRTLETWLKENQTATGETLI